MASEASINAAFSPIIRMLLPSKLVVFCRRMTSSMRGCCHWPGVEMAGEGCCWGVPAFCGVPGLNGVRFSLGRIEVTVVVSGEEVLLVWGAGWRDGAGVRLLRESVRVRAVVDMLLLVWSVAGRCEWRRSCLLCC